MDEALGIQRLMEEFGHTQQAVADALGKDRSTIANLLRILSLPDSIRRMLREEQLTLGHARALLALPDDRARLETAREIVERNLSVREVERMAQRERATRDRGKPKAGGLTGTPVAERAELRRLTELLRRRVQTDVRIELRGDARGTISMAFYSTDDLHRLIELVVGASLDDA
jgi:ParB family chromosome partitioning protein